LAVLLRPDREMPVAGHQAKAADPQGKLRQDLVEDFQEGLVVGRLREPSLSLPLILAC